MKALILLLSLVGAGLAHADNKVCQVGGLYCEDCAQMVKDKVCTGGRYSTCEVKITNPSKELGQLHLVTKDQKATIDEKAVAALMKDIGYTMDKCTPAKGG